MQNQASQSPVENPQYIPQEQQTTSNTYSNQQGNPYQVQGNLAMQPQYQTPTAQVIPFPTQQQTSEYQQPRPLYRQPDSVPYQQNNSPNYTQTSPQDNPWKEALNSVLGLLSSRADSPARTQAYQSDRIPNPLNNQYSAVSYSQSQTSPQIYSQPQYSQEVSGASYSQVSPIGQQEIQMLLRQQLAEERSAEELANVTSNGQFATNEELYQQLGPNAPAILNRSHCQLEDRLAMADELIKVYDQFFLDSVHFTEALKPHAARYEALENLLLDPDALKEYYIQLRLHADGGQVQQQQPQQQVYQQQVPDERQYREVQAFPSMPSQSAPADDPRFDDIRPDLRWLILDKMETDRLIGQERM